LIDNETFRQERNDSHRAMVCSMTVQEDSPRIASCDVDSNIFVWDCYSNLVYTKIKASIKGGALKMSFSQNERHLAGLFLENGNYFLTIFDIHQGIEVTTVCLGFAEVRSLMYKKKQQIVTIGQDHLFTWNLRNGILTGVCIPNKEKFSRDLYCQHMNRLDMIIGTGQGKIQVFRDSIFSESSIFDKNDVKVLVLGCSNL
jgi:WD40 repeat protein